MSQFEYNTKINNAEVVVYLKIESDFDEDGQQVTSIFDGVYFESVDVTGLFSQDQLDKFESDAEQAWSDFKFEESNI